MYVFRALLQAAPMAQSRWFFPGNNWKQIYSMLIKNNPKTSTFLHQRGLISINYSQNGAEHEQLFLGSRTAQKSVPSSSITSFAQMLLGEQRCALSQGPRSHLCRALGHSGFPSAPCTQSLFCWAGLLGCRAPLPPCHGPSPAQRCSCSCAGILAAPGTGSGSSLQTPCFSCCTSCSRSSPAPSASRWNTPAEVCPGSQGWWAGGLSSSLLSSSPGNGLTRLSLGNYWAVVRSSSFFPDPGKFGWRLGFPNNFLITVLNRGRRRGKIEGAEGNLN